MAAKPNVVFGEVEVTPGESLGRVGTDTETVDNVMRMAEAIWGKLRQSGVDSADKKAIDRLACEIQAKYNDFVTAYPIVFRWMLHTNEFEPKVFRQFITRHTKAMYSGRAEFLEKQAEYLMMLYKKRNPRVGAAQLARRRALITQSLKDDDKQFKDAVEKAKGVVEKIDDANDRARRDAIYAWARDHAAGAAGAT